MPALNQKKVDLKFCFKGSRNYVQGGDIYNAVSDWLAANGCADATALDLSMHRLCSQNLTGEISDVPDPVRGENDKLLVRFKSGGQAYTLLLRESGEPITGRNPYPEEDILKAASFDPDSRSISVSEPLPFTNIEIVVALNKELLKRLFPEVTGKWYFTRLQLDRPLGQTGARKIRVQFSSHFNFKLTCSFIELESARLGIIFYSIGV
jgi:hypothetical protein